MSMPPPPPDRAPRHDLVSFIEQVARRTPLAKEKNLFTLGARGHYENPVSDLLAFFLNPLEDHGFGTLFLDTLIASHRNQALPASLPPGSFISVRREVLTEDGKFIDLVIDGEDWLMLVENKIHHIQNNPFASYEKYAAKYQRGRRLILLILSPPGSSAAGNWTGVSYQAFCSEARQRLSSALWSHPPTKWHFFAREFILHLDTLLNRQSMKSEDFQFVLGHLSEFRNAKRLTDDFLLELQERLKSTLLEVEDIEAVTTASNYGWGSPENWAIRCHTQNWGATNIAFAQAPDNDAPGFQLTLYAIALTPAQIETGDRLLKALRPVTYWTEGRSPVWSCWRTSQPIESLDAALHCLKEMAATMHNILALGTAPDIRNA